MGRSPSPREPRDRRVLPLRTVRERRGKGPGGSSGDGSSSEVGTDREKKDETPSGHPDGAVATVV